MAADREWFTVESQDGARGYPDDAGNYDFTNKETAAAVARKTAENSSQPLVIAKYSRREVRTFQRQVTIAEADVSTPATPPA